VEEELPEGMPFVAGQPQPQRRRRNAGIPLGRSRRERNTTEKTPKPSAQPTYNSAADAAAAVQSDGYKPREEKGWEEFHPDLDLDSQLTMYTADEIDGVTPQEREDQDRASEIAGFVDGLMAGQGLASMETVLQDNEASFTTPGSKRRPGRPPRRPEAMLNGLGLVSPPAQKIIPLPTQNPKERLSLAKPSYRLVKTFDTFEADKNVQDNYVTQSMKNVGYQESDKFERPRHFIRLEEDALEDDMEDSLRLESDSDALAAASANGVGKVEYDMDEQDGQWLDAFNIYRKEQEQVDAIKPSIFEITMTQIEKEWHALEKRIPKPTPKPPQTHRPRSGSAAAVNGEPPAAGEEQDSKCAICDDGDCENTNAIVFCDGCDLAVHQECYGVPFIPEGQWLCRKCQQVGRGVPVSQPSLLAQTKHADTFQTCIFCPNSDGAFKLTTESRWSHLLCAIWIPEVSLGNHTFMEPIMEVANVPKQRWKLVCYLCNQKMGACIQCGSKNCYQAFHVTCARKAKLYLKMKAAHGGLAISDVSSMKAFCDKHVPPEWRRQHDVDAATAAAKEYYRHEMRHRKWADSQQSALSIMPAPSLQPIESIEPKQEEEVPLKGAEATQEKKRRFEAERKMWKMPSGAPIVPHVVVAAVDNALLRFTIRKRKEFVTEACKYWTLKREARRGASLLKRLQLQMETFSTMEITRRDYSSLGAAGRPRLQRRIEFAELLEAQMAAVIEVCKQIKDREELKLKDTQLLKDVIDTIYFPVTSMCWPVLEKAQWLARAPPTDQVGTKSAGDVSDEGKRQFTDSFRSIEAKLAHHWYGSVSTFSADLGQAFRFVAGMTNVSDALEAHQLLSGSVLREENLTPDQREIKKLAKRIARAVQPPLQDAFRHESELIHGRPFEAPMHDSHSIMNSSDHVTPEDGGQDAAVQGVSHHQIICSETGHVSPPLEADDRPPPSKRSKSSPRKSPAKAQPATTLQEPLTPPSSVKDIATVSLPQGGIPWYLEGFEPDGLSVQDERYDGLKVRREMSEPLSEMDEAELTEMGVSLEPQVDASVDAVMTDEVGAITPAKKAPTRKRKRSKW